MSHTKKVQSQFLLGAVRKLRNGIGVLSWSEKANFCLFLVLKRGTYLVKNSQKCAYVIYERPLIWYYFCGKVKGHPGFPIRTSL